MAFPGDPTPSDVSQLGASGDGEEGSSVRQAVSRATTRIEEIIDSAERVASEIRADAEAEANQLLESRRREAQELEREAENLRAETERLRREREEVIAGVAQGLGSDLSDLRSSFERALASIDRTEQAINGLEVAPPPPVAAPAPDPAPTPFTSDPSASPFSSAPAVAPAPMATPIEPDPEPEPFGAGLGTSDFSSPAAGEVPETPAYDADDDVAAAPEPDSDMPADLDEVPEPVATDPLSPAGSGQSSDEAMLRATQMAVAGSSRDEIGRTLEAEFGIDDPELILGQILGPA